MADLIAGEIEAVKPKLYAEPFLGGGAIALALSRKLPKILSDINATLIDVWTSLRSIPETLYRELQIVEERYGENQIGYYKAREALNNRIHSPRATWAERAALAIYINARCFNGLWRTNEAGFYNVPYGHIAKPRSLTFEEIDAYSKFLKPTARFATGDFRVILARETSNIKGLAIYADPVYDGTYDGYSSSGFDEQDQRDLAEMLERFAARGAHVWATNADTPLIREIYSWAEISETDEYHAVGAKAERRGKRGCLLIRRNT